MCLIALAAVAVTWKEQVAYAFDPVGARAGGMRLLMLDLVLNMAVAAVVVSGDRVLSGTTVTAGEGLMRATAVGERAYAHRLAREARRFSKVGSELQEGTDRVLRWISGFGL